MLPREFKPEALYDLVRLGRDHDGGYLVEKASIEKAEALVSFGVSDDWSFERSFLSRKEVPLSAYDPTTTQWLFLYKAWKALGDVLVLRKPFKFFLRSLRVPFEYRVFFRKGRAHYRSMVGRNDRDDTVSLKTVLSKIQLRPLFLKIDIEGTEHEMFDDLIACADQCCGLVVEIHDMRLHRQGILDFLRKYPLTLVHIHPNNYGGVDSLGDPRVCEFTFARSPAAISASLELPHRFDFANTPRKKDLLLRFAKTALGVDANHPIIVSGANDEYMNFLLDMLASIQNCLHEYDLGILDLGLSEESKDRIRAYKKEVRIIDPGWCYQPGDMSKQSHHKKAYYAKPFLPDIFPGYSGYMWIDADVWLQDPSTIEHYIAASKKAPGKGAIAFECHPSYKDINYKPRFRIVWKFRVLPVAIRAVSRKVFRLVYDMFGDEIARQYGLSPDNNSGLFFIHADSPAWDAWQSYMSKANHQNFISRDYFPDQTCLNVALRSNDISFTAMPATYNWIVGMCQPILDEGQRLLRDPCSPHNKLHAIHLTNRTGFQMFNLRTTDGGHFSTSLRRSAFLQTLTDRLPKCP